MAVHRLSSYDKVEEGRVPQGMRFFFVIIKSKAMNVWIKHIMRSWLFLLIDFF